ncbi:hypothetical protein EW146_g7731 [Bondarzewia mesenterica]|uniref:Uncharacterized protein n=1 Tax=Bondarzewia mesenterica TaxID=1095465 RepID=A0A4V3XE57_9AGAM|nr:hypothetical protein EW146_g7731 [Bondarzewia mesenterica]
MADSSKSVPSLKSLNGHNYPTSVKEMSAWLRLKGLWLLVSGVETCPDDSLAMLKLEWQGNQQKAAGAIILCVDENCRGVLDGLEDDPIAMWAKLESTFNEKWAGSQFNALEDLFSIRKKEDQSLQSLIYRIDEAMRVLKTLLPVDYDLKVQDEELICMVMLWSLPADFDAFRSSLNLIDNLTRSKLENTFSKGTQYDLVLLTEILQIAPRGEFGSWGDKAMRTPKPLAKMSFVAVQRAICFVFDLENKTRALAIHPKTQSFSPDWG